MRRSVEYLPEAVADLESQIEAYAGISKELARRFVTSVENSVRFIGRFPQASPVIGGAYRRKVLGKPFRVSVIYQIRGEGVLILAVWPDRMDDRLLEDRTKPRDAEPEQ